MICPNCNTNTPEDSLFCQNCGSKFEESNAIEAFIRTEEVENRKEPEAIVEQSFILEQNLDFVPNPSNPVITVQRTNPTISVQPTAVDYIPQIPSKNSIKSPIRIIAYVFLGFVFAGLIGLNIYQYIDSDKTKANLEEHIFDIESTLEDQKDKIISQDDIIESQESTISSQEQELVELQEYNDALFEWNNDLFEQASFMDDYIAIVSDDGSYLYHRYTCEYLDTSSFWAYNINAAIQEGYSACPYCYD